MKLPKLKIRGLESRFPVIQAGMGIKVATSDLAAAAVDCGAFGTIASVGLGQLERSLEDYLEDSRKSLIYEIGRARDLTGGKKPLGVNIMVALSNYEQVVRAAVEAGVDFIISGAGLPLPLPEYVGDADIALIPVISSRRALDLVLKTWARKYDRMPDAVVVEGPRCGGHLGFTMEQIEHPETCALDFLYGEVRAAMAEYGLDVPVIGAGEVACRGDIEKMLSIGYDGVQIGTRFIVAEEAGIDRVSKQVFIDAKPEDVTIIHSPVGLPVRVLRTPLIDRLEAGGKEDFTCAFRCLRTCKPSKVSFCIAKALVSAWLGDVENGIFMTGCNVGALEEVAPLKNFFRDLED